MQSFMTEWICEISASSWFYYKEICYDAWLHERKIQQVTILTVEELSCKYTMDTSYQLSQL
jgi:hypothetical protein